MMLAEPRLWSSGPPGPDTTLSPRRRARSHQASPEPTENAPHKRRRRSALSLFCGLTSSSRNLTPTSEPPETPRTPGFEPATGDARCEFADLWAEHLQFAGPEEDSCPPESDSIDDFQSPAGEAKFEAAPSTCPRPGQLQPTEPDEKHEPAVSPSPSDIHSPNGGVGCAAPPCPVLESDQVQCVEPGEPAKSSGWCFYNFPAEIRNMIYEYSLGWPTSLELYAPYNRLIDKYYATSTEQGFPEYNGVLRTPTILLLCRRITAECLPILQSRLFVIDRLPPWPPGAPRPMLVSQFVGRRTIQSLRHIEIRLPMGQGGCGSGWVWARIATDILNILQERNSFEDLKIVVSIFNDTSRAIWDLESGYLNTVTNTVRCPVISRSTVHY